MGIFSKLFDAVRETVHGSEVEGEQNQALRVLEQEVRDSKAHLYRAKENMMELVGKQAEMERNLKPLQSAYQRYENEASQALHQGKEALAAQHAERMAELENEMEFQREVINNYRQSVQDLKQQIKLTERNILSVEREIQVIRAMESIHQANRQGDKLGGLSNYAQEALERVRQRQQQRDDERAAAVLVQQESKGDDLRARLQSAGLIKNDNTSREEILKRLKFEQAMSNERIRWVKKNVY